MVLPPERAAWLPEPIPQPGQTAGQQDLCAVAGCQTGPWEVEKMQLTLLGRSRKVSAEKQERCERCSDRRRQQLPHALCFQESSEPAPLGISGKEKSKAFFWLFLTICWIIQSMQTARGYRFPLGEYFLLFLASLPLICSLTLEATFIFQGCLPCCTSLVWRVMSLLQCDFSFKSLLCKAEIISPGHKEKAGEKEGRICGILWC